VSVKLFCYFFPTFLHCIAPNAFLSAINSVAGSVLVISGTYILLWGKSKEEEQCAVKGTQESQEDEECKNNLEASSNVPSKLRPNEEQGFSELQVKQLAITVTRS